MKKNSLTFQTILDRVDEYVVNTGQNPTHVFTDPSSFYHIMRDVSLNINRYWLPEKYGSEEKIKGLHQLEFMHAEGQAVLKEVMYNSDLLVIGDEKAYLNCIIEKELLGEK